MPSDHTQNKRPCGDLANSAISRRRSIDKPEAVYHDLDQDDVTALTGHANTIKTTIDSTRRKLTEAIVEIGSELAQAQAILAGKGREGLFRPWFTECCGLAKSTVYRAIAAYEAFGKCPTVGHFDAKAIYLLSSDSCPEEATQEAIRLADRGEYIDYGRAKEIATKYAADGGDDAIEDKEQAKLGHEGGDDEIEAKHVDDNGDDDVGVQHQEGKKGKKTVTPPPHKVAGDGHTGDVGHDHDAPAAIAEPQHSVSPEPDAEIGATGATNGKQFQDLCVLLERADAILEDAVRIIGGLPSERIHQRQYGIIVRNILRAAECLANRLTEPLPQEKKPTGGQDGNADGESISVIPINGKPYDVVKRAGLWYFRHPGQSDWVCCSPEFVAIISKHLEDK